MRRREREREREREKGIGLLSEPPPSKEIEESRIFRKSQPPTCMYAIVAEPLEIRETTRSSYYLIHLLCVCDLYITTYAQK